MVGDFSASKITLFGSYMQKVTKGQWFFGSKFFGG